MAKNNANQNAANYVKTKGINELFEAMMTALMVRKPDDHISFIRQCLDRIDDQQTDVCWDYFLTKSSLSIIKKRYKSLPPIQRSKPIIFILSNGSMRLCSRLLKRYPHVHYLSINSIGNIDDDDEPIDLSQHEHRFDLMKAEIDERYSTYDGFIIAGELNEQFYLEKWFETLDRIDLVIMLTREESCEIFNENFRLIQINCHDDLENILSISMTHFDRLFPQDAFASQRASMIPIQRKFLHFPVLFCLDTHQYSIDNDEEYHTNSFLSTLCQRLSADLAFRYIQYKNFEELQNKINQSSSQYSGFIIAQFPTSFNDLCRFECEIGPCALLICIGGRGSNPKLNEIIDKFQSNDKAIYVNSQMEISDIKEDILKHL